MYKVIIFKLIINLVHYKIFKNCQLNFIMSMLDSHLGITNQHEIQIANLIIHSVTI